jgi:uncharacterized membrane protein YdbT with pleckstrin-like domain
MGNYVDESLGKGETVKYTARVSLWRYWFNFIIGSFLALGSLPLFLMAIFASSKEKEHNPFVYSIAIWLVVALCLLVWPFIARRSTELAITDKRLIAKYGVISTQSIEIRFDKIETVRVKQGLLGRMFNYGDIVVTGTGSTFDPIRNIANAKIFRNALNQAMDLVSPPGKPAAAAA